MTGKSPAARRWRSRRARHAQARSQLASASQGIAQVAQACASLRDFDAIKRQAAPNSTTPAGTAIPTGVSTSTGQGSQWLPQA